MNFADNLKKYRINKGLSQKQLAEVFKVSPSSITMYETGQREPNFTLLDQMATFFEISTDVLLGRNQLRNENPLNNEITSINSRVNDLQLELDEIKNYLSKLQ
jgi:transcriptional regulator with XRE-family HTH domain